MNGAQTCDTRWNVEARLIRKAMTDPDYRRDLLFRTREVVERELGGGLPDDVAVVVLNEKPGEVIMVLPWEGHHMMGSLDMPAGESADDTPVDEWARATLRAAQDEVWRNEIESNPGALLANPMMPEEQGRRGRKRKLRVKVKQEGPRIVQIVLPHPSRAAQRVGDLYPT